MADDFKWSDVDDDLVLSRQHAVAVYENPRGDTVIRQEADHYSRDEDSIIIINRNNLAAFVAFLQNHLRVQQERNYTLPAKGA